MTRRSAREGEARGGSVLGGPGDAGDGTLFPAPVEVTVDSPVEPPVEAPVEPPVEAPVEPPGDPVVEVRRSARRRRTVSAYREGGRTIVLIPARMSRAEERRWVSVMLERLARQDARLRPSDDALLARATDLARRHLDGRARPASVRWVDNQRTRWGSCTPRDRSIRLSTRLQGMPGWVVDYVIVHELAHLLESGHTEAFWRMVDRYPKAERAKGYLEGVESVVRATPPADA
jgi:predicted metal-dependent hydrolase